MLALYTVSDAYIHYLRTKNGISHVYDNKNTPGSHGRKYLGVMIRMGTVHYFAPLSSPKPSDYLPDGTIRDSNISVFRMTKKVHGKPVLLGTIKILNMIPVPDSELCYYDLQNETDLNYRNLIENELRWIEHNDTRILKSVSIIYNMKIHEETRRTSKNARLLDAILPFPKLEQLCTDWAANHLRE